MSEIEVALDGYRVADQGSLGEMGLRSILAEALPPDMLTQTADGWGADEAVTLVDNSAGEAAWVYSFKGDSVDDTVEVAQGFLDHAEQVLGQSALVAGGGVEYVGDPYVFVDREDDGLVVVIASSVDAGRSAGGRGGHPLTAPAGWFRSTAGRSTVGRWGSSGRVETTRRSTVDRTGRVRRQQLSRDRRWAAGRGWPCCGGRATCDVSPWPWAAGYQRCAPGRSPVGCSRCRRPGGRTVRCWPPSP